MNKQYTTDHTSHLLNGAKVGRTKEPTSSNGATNGKADTKGIVFRTLNTVKAVPIPWLWRGYLARQQVTLVAAAGGAGKTHVVEDLLARATLGVGMPNGGVASAPMRVAVVTSENDAGYIMRPQIEASMRNLLAGEPDIEARVEAALARIDYIDGIEEEVEAGLKMTVPLSFPKDTHTLRAYLAERKPGLLIFDPLISFTGEAVNTKEQSDVRRMMDGLGKVASEFDMTIIAVIHFNKNGEGDLINRVIGSRQYTDFARMVLTVLVEERDAQGEYRRWLASAKCNFVKDPEAISFFIEGERDEPSTIRWDYTREAKAEEIDAEIRESKNNRSSATRVAADFLRKRLVALWNEGQDTISADDLEGLRTQANVSKSTWVKAKRDVGIKTSHDDSHDGWAARLAGLPFLPSRSQAGEGKYHVNTEGL